MTESDLRLIETELGITLPDQYRRVMLDNPLARYVNPTELGTTTTSLLSEPQSVIEVNQQLRETGFIIPLPPTYFCFAEDRWEDSWTAYFLDLSLENSPVYWASTEKKESDDYEIYFPTLADWIENEDINMEDLEEYMREQAERRRTKKWWQFWI